jgi:hypothetical protein
MTPQPALVKTRGRRLRRKARRFRLHLPAMVVVALLVCVVGLVVSNSGRVPGRTGSLGSGSVPPVLVVVLAALLGSPPARRSEGAPGRRAPREAPR